MTLEQLKAYKEKLDNNNEQLLKDRQILEQSINEEHAKTDKSFEEFWNTVLEYLDIVPVEYFRGVYDTVYIGNYNIPIGAITVNKDSINNVVQVSFEGVRYCCDKVYISRALNPNDLDNYYKIGFLKKQDLYLQSLSEAIEKVFNTHNARIVDANRELIKDIERNKGVANES